MPYRQPSPSRKSNRGRIPRLWLFTDERMNGDPVAAARALPPRSGIVFRHYATPPRQRALLLRHVRRIAHARGHWLLVGGETHRSLRHGPPPRGPTVSAGVHDFCQAAMAHRAGISVAFISPVFATRSHVAATPLGIAGFARLARIVPGKPIALGGMDASKFRLLRRHGAHGWGAIDALTV